MSAGDYYAPVTGTAWQPQQGRDIPLQVRVIAVGDPPDQYMPPWWGVLPASTLDPRVTVTTEIISSGVTDPRIATLEADVARLRQECKRLQRRLAQRRRT